ncbi:site-specific recombinase XerD [Catenulispora sp. GAS73]|uniref:tyrosine-type recombinase/integrase n=1 Tax=Catenulispora sp. GAS73 TaxID=3156269 RepID=UPI003513C8F2
MLVNLFRGRIGAPMRPQALNELLTALSKRAGLDRSVHPHLLRHRFATNIAEGGGTLDEIQLLLGHAAITSSQVYLHPSPQRLRAAVDRVASPRAGDER